MCPREPSGHHGMCAKTFQKDNHPLLEQGDPKLFIGCRYNRWERSWGGKKKVGHRGSAEECIAHVRNRHSAKVPVQKTHKCMS